MEENWREINWNGKTYTWWTNLENTKVEKRQFREIHPTGILGDPRISRVYKTMKKARENNQIGGYVLDTETARNEIIYIQKERRMKYVNELLDDNGEF